MTGSAGLDKSNLDPLRFAGRRVAGLGPRGCHVGGATPGPDRGRGFAGRVARRSPPGSLRVNSTAGEVPVVGSFAVGLFPNGACGFPPTPLSSDHRRVVVVARPAWCGCPGGMC